jgi:hypothetical protein
VGKLWDHGNGRFLFYSRKHFMGGNLIRAINLIILGKNKPGQFSRQALPMAFGPNPFKVVQPPFDRLDRLFTGIVEFSIASMDGA